MTYGMAMQWGQFVIYMIFGMSYHDTGMYYDINGLHPYNPDVFQV